MDQELKNQYPLISDL